MPFRLFDYVFPVGGGESTSVGIHLRKLYGTAFSIGGNVFVTAGHTMREAATHSHVGIGIADEREGWVSHRIIRHEIFDQKDLAVFQCDMPEAKSRPWIREEQDHLAPVVAVGYPHALDVFASVLRVRAFKGTVVCNRIWSWTNMTSRAYELSFQCPVGLSGAPLWLDQKGSPQVIGVVFGNSSVGSVVYEETETTVEGGKQLIVQRTESMRLGLAVTAEEVLKLHSTILGSTIESHLVAQGLLPKAVSS